MVERAARVEPYAVLPSRPLDRVGGHERRAGDHGAAVEHLHLAQALAAANRQLDLHRRHDALDEGPLDVNDAEGRLRGDEADAAAHCAARAVVYVREPSVPRRSVAREPHARLREVGVPLAPGLAA